jgi:predicted DNA-binding protein (MmcQ/YjbR family)
VTAEKLMAHPRMYHDSNPMIRRLRKICLALPHVVEREAWGECTFRVEGGTMFAMTDHDHHDSGHIGVWIKAPQMVQEILVGSSPETFYKPPYLGHKGWVGVRLDGAVDWQQVAEIVQDGHRMSAPKTPRAPRSSTRKDRKPSERSKPSV